MAKIKMTTPIVEMVPDIGTGKVCILFLQNI